MNAVYSRQIIKQELEQMAEAFRVYDYHKTIEVYLLRLMEVDIETEKLVIAIRRAMVTCTKFPTLSDLLRFAGKSPIEKDHGIEIANLIISCISSYGRSGKEEAYKKLGVYGQSVVEAFGGWNTLCETTYENLNIVRAQLRELATVHASKINDLPNTPLHNSQQIGTNGKKNIGQSTTNLKDLLDNTIKF